MVVGSQFRTYQAALTAGRWYHLAVTAQVSGTQRTFTLYLDGTQLGQPLTIAANASGMPHGTLRFGKYTTGQTVNGHNAQYFGFLDDIAIFSRELTVAEIQNLRTNVLHLTCNESNLLAGYTFADGQLPSRLARPITLHGPAQRVSTSANRHNASDAALLPLPSGHRTMHLPFPFGEA
jgi:Concanavalin A-like lectin/glucanases superfamily